MPRSPNSSRRGREASRPGIPRDSRPAFRRRWVSTSPIAWTRHPWNPQRERISPAKTRLPLRPESVPGRLRALQSDSGVTAGVKTSGFFSYLVPRNRVKRVCWETCRGGPSPPPRWRGRAPREGTPADARYPRGNGPTSDSPRVGILEVEDGGLSRRSGESELHLGYPGPPSRGVRRVHRRPPEQVLHPQARGLEISIR